VAGLRALTFAALAAVTAAIAHGGLATLADPRWATAALSGAGVAALVMWRGWALVARWGKIEDTASLAALIPAMLAAQTAAHLALAVVAAVVVQLIDVQTQRRALAALTAPRRSEQVGRRAPAAGPRHGLAAWHRRDRAPPLSA